MDYYAKCGISIPSYFGRNKYSSTEFGATEYVHNTMPKVNNYAAEMEYIHLVKSGPGSTTYLTSGANCIKWSGAV